MEDTPHLKITISGSDPTQAAEFDAVIDTGFSGFIMMPVGQATALGLVENGVTTDIILADASTQPRQIAEGMASIGDQSEAGMIILDDESTEVLIGMRLVRDFGLALFLTQDSVFVVNEAEAVRRAEEAKRAKAAKGNG